MSRLRKMLFRGQDGLVPCEYFVRDETSARILADLIDEAGMARWEAEEPDENNPFPSDEGGQE